MTNKHTPGPWKVSELGLTNSGQKAVMYYPDNKEDETKHICFVSCQADFKHGKGYVAECSVREANARLIAAAPDLLEACEASHNAKTQADLDRAVIMIEAAIAKARGSK